MLQVKIQKLAKHQRIAPNSFCPIINTKFERLVPKAHNKDEQPPAPSPLCPLLLLPRDNHFQFLAIS